jgi:hypothetical protein
MATSESKSSLFMGAQFYMAMAASPDAAKRAPGGQLGGPEPTRIYSLAQAVSESESVNMHSIHLQLFVINWIII